MIMKNLALLLLSLITIKLSAQTGEDITICHTPATEQFAMLASNNEFVASHQLPSKYLHQTEKGKKITYKTADGKTANAFLYEAAKPTNNYILVIHEWWGLNDQIKREAEKLFDELGNVHVLALDLYDGKVTDQREEAAKLMGAVSTERAVNIVNGAFDFAGKDAKIGTIGWCFGGGWSLQTTLLAGKRAQACVIYYGMPEKDVEKLKTLNTDVLGIFASQEQWISPAVVQEFAANMEKAGKKLTYKMFDAEHGFANPSNSIYNKEYAEEAFNMSVSYFQERLK